MTAVKVANEQRIPVADVVYRKDLYPRIKQNAETVQKYAASLDVLPPIEVNQRLELIDGWHRWTAHKKAEADTIAVVITETRSDVHLLELAISRNAKHGLQLSESDKEEMARRIYGDTPYAQRSEKRAELKVLLSTSDASLTRWLSRSDKELTERLKRDAFNLWLGCSTQEEIAEAIGVPRQTVTRWIDDFAQTDHLSDLSKTLAAHMADFEKPIYNIWKQQDKTPGVTHFGNSEVRWLDNLLYLYTQPFDIVVDPFAGGGSTIDVCRRRMRRFWVSDRKPIVERKDEIREHDINAGLPKPPQWKDVRLVYLDPPYWKQAQGKYSKDPEDLANMELHQFHQTLASTVNAFGKKLPESAAIALIIQPTQWAAPNHAYTDHIAAMLGAVKLPLDMRFSVPYESQQYNAQTVEWAKANRRCLVLTREIVVWKVQ